MNLKVIRRFKVLCAPVLLLLLFSQAYSGTLDPTFGTGGKVTVDFPFSSSPDYDSNGSYIFVQPSGRIVAVGNHRQRGGDGITPGVVMAGLTSSGAIDTTFGGSGKTLEWMPNAFIGLSDAQMLADGKIMRLGQFIQLFSTFSARLKRLDANGSEESFAPDLHVSDSQPLPEKFAVQSDGKILVIIRNGTSTIRYYLVRLNMDGSRDAAFGANGVKEIPRISPMSDSRIIGMQITPNGKILIAGQSGYSDPTGDYSELFLVRLSPEGYADSSFGRLGLVRRTFGGQRFRASSLIVQPEDNKYIVSGLIKTPDNDALIVRFTQSGRPDYNFGSGGVVITDFTPDGNDLFNGVKLLSDGKIIAVGQASNPPSTFSNFLVAKYSLNGGLESHTQTSFTPSQNSAALNAVIQPDGKILVVGFTRNPNSSINGNIFAIARYTAITND